MSAEARSWLLVVSAAAAVLTMAIQAMVPAVPALGEALDLSTPELGWFTIAYLVPTVVLTVPSGMLTARLGPRRVFVAALVVYAIAGMAQGLLESYIAILLLRVVQGLCFAIAMPTTIALIAEAFVDRRQLRAFSVREIGLTVAGLVWPLLGTALATISWRAPFFAQGLMLFVALAFAVLPAPHEGHAEERPRRGIGMLGALRAERLSFNVMLLAFGRYFFRFVIVTFAPVLIVISGDGSLTQAGVLVAIVAGASALSAATMDRLFATMAAAQLALLSCVAYCVGLVGIGLAGDSWWMLAPAIAFGFGDGVLAVLSDVYAARLWREDVRVQILAVSQTFRNLGKLAAPVMMSVLVLVIDVRGAFIVVGALTIPFLFGLVPLRSVDERVAHAEQT